MTTPLGLAKRLRMAFPEFLDVRVIREAPYSLRALCVLAPSAAPASQADIDSWVADNKMSHTVVSIDQVASLPAKLDDEEALLQRTSIKRIIVEETNTAGRGFETSLREAFPNRIVRIGGGSMIAVEVLADTPAELQAQIHDVARLLLPCDPEGLAVVPASGTTVMPPEASVKESAEVLRRFADDLGLLHDRLPHVLTLASEESIGQPLPAGAGTFASPHDGIESVMQRLALFDRVFVQMPFSAGDFPQWAGSSLSDFIDLLPTGRVIPVFAHALERYESGLASRVLDAGAPRVILRGEATLRSIRGFAADHPLLGLIQSPDGVQLRRALRQSNDAEVAPLKRYAEAIAEVADRVDSISINGPTMAVAWHPIAQWLDALIPMPAGREHELEFGAALDHRAMTEALGGTPLSKAGHYLDGYLRLLYGVHAVETNVLSVPEPGIIGRIAFPDTTGLSPREFAETFTGPAVTAMRTLMQSRRVQTASECEDVVREFNRELVTYSRRSEAYAATGIILTVAGMIGPLGLPTALLGLFLELARRVMSRKAPAAFSTLTSKVTRTTREAALLAQIRKQQG